MISIIIPAYNSELYISRCIESILAQTYEDLEIICINDCSTDDTLREMESWAEKDSRIVIINNKVNTGISFSRNAGIESAHGEWIMFVDSDDWMDPNTCELALAKAKQNQADLIMWCYIREYENDSIPKLFCKEERTWDKEIKKLQRRMFGPFQEELKYPDQLDSWGTIWGKLYRRDVILTQPKTLFVDTDIIGTAEDVIFNIDYLQKARKAVLLPKTLYHYRKTITSFTSQHRDNLAEKWEKLYEEMEKRIKTYLLGDDAEEALQNRIAIGVLGLGLVTMRGNGTWNNKRKELNSILLREKQEKALQLLQLKYLSPHWKLFYWTAKHHLTTINMLILSIIERIINKN